MKKNLKILKIIFMAFVMIILFNTKSNANTIERVDMEVYLDTQGNAQITEVWIAKMDKGTEGYKTYKNMGNSSISNFTVTDESGANYQSLASWNTGGSMSSKAYKCGLNYISGGVELCWGISQYGNKKYTLKYDISNFVIQYSDKQGIYFNFLNIDENVGNVDIKIRSDFDFSLDNSRIWGFGNNGSINFNNGEIFFTSGGKLSSSQRMVGLVRFEKDLFNTVSKSSKSFDDVYDSAMVGVKESKGKKSGGLNFSGLFINVLEYAGIFVFLYYIKGKRRSWKSNYTPRKPYTPMDLGGKVDKSNVEYFREIPCDGDIFFAYWVLVKYDVFKEEECKNGLIGAILFDYMKKGYIKICESDRKVFNFKDNNYYMDMNALFDPNLKVNEVEKSLIGIFKGVAGANNLLETKEFEKWCKKHYDRINGWFDSVIEYETIRLQQRRLITESNQMVGNRTYVKKIVDASVKQQADHLLGLRKFLLDYSLISEKESIEVKLWEDYLIFAQLLGIADKVEEQFSKIYPDFKKYSKIDTRYAILYSAAFSSCIVNEVFRETERARIRSERAQRFRDYSGHDNFSGGGGSSFSDGGGSAGGSSGGGFR